MNCPNSPARCCCPEHHMGLAAFAPDLIAYLAALNKATAVKARRLESIPIPETLQEYRGDQRQPWEPRPPRHLRAA